MPGKNLTLGNLYTALGIAGVVLAAVVWAVRWHDGLEQRWQEHDDRIRNIHNRFYVREFPEEPFSIEYRKNNPQYFVPF